MKQKIEREINRYKQFSYSVLGKHTEFDEKQNQLDIRNYAKHILRSGTKDEKRELLNCLKNKIEIKEKQISFSIELDR